MPDIDLEVRQDEYVTDLNVSIFACRSFARIRFIDQSGSLTSYTRCLVDSGAPLSVIPFTLWQALNLQWQHLGSQLTLQGRPVPKALDWLSVPCDLGVVSGYLVNAHTGVETGPYIV